MRKAVAYVDMYTAPLCVWISPSWQNQHPTICFKLPSACLKHSFISSSLCDTNIGVLSGVTGGMLELYKRRRVPLAMYCLLAGYALEVGALALATAVHYHIQAENLVGVVKGLLCPRPVF